MQITCRWWKEGKIKRSLSSGLASQRAGLAEFAAYRALWLAAPTPETAPASHCHLGVGDSLGHAQGAEPSSSRAAAAEGGAGRARVSATELQVAAGVGLRLSSEGECCPPTPPIPWPAQSPMSTAHRSPGGHEGQRRSGAWGMANARWGAARWAARPLPGNNQGSAEGGRDPSPS